MSEEGYRPIEPAKDLETAAKKPAVPLAATVPTSEERKALERKSGGPYDMKGMG